MPGIIVGVDSSNPELARMAVQKFVDKVASEIDETVLRRP
jgi:hypothetical protein